MHIAQEDPILFEIFDLTQLYSTKLRAIVPNTNYLKPIVLRFKTIIHNSISKIICSFCMYGGYTHSGKKFFTVDIFRKKASKFAKLKVETHIWDNLK